jgi:predicted DNA-binding protein (MmcQ/YjbR family)
LSDYRIQHWEGKVYQLSVEILQYDLITQWGDEPREVKIDPILSGSLRSDPGIHPAYHMNKDKWVSIELAVAPEETIELLVEMSFDATAPKAKRSIP